MRSFVLIVAHCAIFISPSYASISWQSGNRFILSGSGVTQSHSAPSGSIEAIHRREHPLGTNITKAKNDFRVENDIYKSTSFFQVRTTHPTVNLELLGSYMDTSAELHVSQTTTLRIDHQLTGHFSPRDQFFIRLRNLSDGSTVFVLDTAPTSEFSLVTISPGNYRFTESYDILGTVMPEPRNRQVTTHLSISVVPSPTTLATLTPLGIATTRRKRC